MELLVALAIFGVVLIALGSFEVNLFSYKNSVSESLQTSQNSQVILKTILSEIREASPAANGAYPLASAGSTTLSFYSDYDNDGVAEKITYTLIDSNLYRAVGEPSGNPPVYSVASQATSTIIVGVSNGNELPLFQYFDENYTGTSSALTLPAMITNVKLIKVNVQLDLDPRRSPLPVVYSIQASLRNLKDNL